MVRSLSLNYCFFFSAAGFIPSSVTSAAQSFNRVPSHAPAADPKEEKEAQKPEEATKLQNGDGSKESAASAGTASAGAAGEEKKKAKTRFMFNIADGGFTGKKRGARSSWQWEVVFSFQR